MRRELSSQWQDLGEFIRGQREITQLSLRRLAELADVSNPYLSQIERGLRRPSAEILQQIAKALQISAESLYVRAGILDADTIADTSVREAILRDPYLTIDQKQTLLTVYESFVAHAAEAAADDHDRVAAAGDEPPPAGSEAQETRPTA
jgi:transcriptional regulator with XRE-family HTH domain